MVKHIINYFHCCTKLKIFSLYISFPSIICTKWRAEIFYLACWFSWKSEDRKFRVLIFHLSTSKLIFIFIIRNIFINDRWDIKSKFYNTKLTKCRMTIASNSNLVINTTEQCFSIWMIHIIVIQYEIKHHIRHSTPWESMRVK